MHRPQVPAADGPVYALWPSGFGFAIIKDYYFYYYGNFPLGRNRRAAGTWLPGLGKISTLWFNFISLQVKNAVLQEFVSF